jgi:hypothetical protein
VAPLPPAPVTTAATAGESEAKGPVSVGVVIALGLVAALVAAGITYLIVRPDDESGATAVRSVPITAAAPDVPVTSAPTTIPNTLRPSLVEMETLLNDSGTGRRSLNDAVLGPFTACDLSGASAAAQMSGVISNRQRILDQASRLAQNADATVSNLGTLLRQAIQYSLDSNHEYQSWMSENPGTVCPRTGTASRTRGDASSSRATAAKEAFVSAYNPVAASNGLKSNWTAQDI